MKFKTQAVLGLLFLSSFIKSFKHSPTLYDSVFIILITILYLAQDYLTEQKVKKDVEKLTMDLDLKFKHLEEEMDRTRSIASKNALAMGFKR